MDNKKPLLQILIASTRPARKGLAVAHWFVEEARAHGRFAIEVVDLAEVDLPFFDEPKHPRFGEYEHEHTRQWSATIARADAFVFVTAEYDFSPPAALLNALHYLVKEWAYKPVGFCSYGGVSGGTRSVQMIKLVVTGLKMMPMFEQVAIPFFAQHIDKESGRFDPGKVQADAVPVMLNELLRWTNALAVLREPA